MIKFENKVNGRFYYIFIEKDMVHDCVLRILYGGVNVSRARNLMYGDIQTLRQEIERLTKKRLSRGYSLVT